MADAEPYINPQKLASQFPQNYGNPNRFYTQFLYKVLFVAIFLVVVPLLPSQAPEFIHQTLHTRSWELVQVILVGIAVSYGLFSRKNEESEKENLSKIDNAHSYVSRFLQVSSVFDDEAETPTGSDENKVQTWSNQYSRGEPVVVVAQENSVLDEQRGTATPRVVEKPLLLPVRSLKSRVPSPGVTETSNESSGKGGSTSKRFSSNSVKSRNGEIRGGSSFDFEEKVEEDIVLRSPIPWRSRSGRMEMKEETEGVPLYSLPPSSMEESRSSFRSSRPNSASPSPKNLSPSHSFSSESQAKSFEEVSRKKIIYCKSQPPSPAPPPPPPPPPLYVRKPPLMKSNSTLPHPELSSGNELKRSVRSVPTEFSGNGREGIFQSRRIPGEEFRPRVPTDSSLAGKSVRTIRTGESVNTNGKSIHQSPSRTDSVNYGTESEHEFEEEKDVETDMDSDSEDDAFEIGAADKEEVGSGSGGPDVNKKAEEFIAKFREQIRLQRIESIKRSTEHISARNSSNVN